MADASLEVECLQQLRDYVHSLGGELSDEWTCRAQLRDYGSRAGSVDTWFTSPTGEVFRSKVAAARGMGLETTKTTNTKRPKQARKPAAPKETSSGGDGAAEVKAATAAPAKAGGGGGGADSRWQSQVLPAVSSRPIDLNMQEIGELLMSMPDATDVDDCYEGPLFYKEAQLRHAARLASRAAAAAAAEREAAEQAAAEEAAAMAEAEAAAAAAERAERLERRRGGSPGKLLDAATAAAVQVSRADVEMTDADAGSAGYAGDEEMKEDAGEAQEKIPAGEANTGAGEDEEEDEGREVRGADGVSARRRKTRASLVAAVAAAAALLQSQSDAHPSLHHVVPVDGAPALSAPAEVMDTWSVELEVIRKCFVRVPVRVGRHEEDEPAPMSPNSRDEDLTEALLALSDDGGEGASNDGGNDCPREGAASCADWQTKRFPLDQLTANGGEPTALHPAALFYLRYLEEEEAAAERAAKREAEDRAARKAARQALLSGDGTAPARLPLPKPSNLSLRGKSIEEVEAALMERLESYVSDLGGILPAGWRIKASVRQNGANAGGVDAYYYEPSGKRHKSMVKVAEALGLEASGGAKPKTLSSILGTSRSREKGPRGGGVTAAMEDPPPAGEDAVEGEGQDRAASPEPAGAAGGGGAGSPMATPPLDAVGGDDGAGTSSGRKTCGVCRTCLNPQLKKGCLVNRKKKNDSGQKSAAQERSPSPSPPPAKKLTARQAAKIEREARKQAEREAAKAAERVAAEEEEKEAAAAAAAQQQQAAEDEDAEAMDVDIGGIPPVMAAANAAVATAGGKQEEDKPAVAVEEPAAAAYPAVELAASELAASEPLLIDTAQGAELVAAPVSGQDQLAGPDATFHLEEPVDGSGGATMRSQRSSGAAGGGASGSEAAGDVKGSKRSRSEATAAGSGGGGSGGGDDDEDDEDGGGKRPKKGGDEKVDDADGNGEEEEEQGGGGVRPRDRRTRKQVNSAFNKAKETEEEKKKRETVKAARREKRELREKSEVVRTVYDRALNRLKGQLSRLRQEQALVEAYAADGWRGASREKVKPVAEIKRAKEAIKRCKEVIRECVKVCDEAEGDQAIPAELFDEDGELDLDHLFCSKCRGNESTDDNDIIMCDGHCDRAYHVKCLVPPVDPATLPEDEGWLCPACDRKIDMIDDINDEFGTDYDYDTPWEQVLAPGTLPVSPPAVDGAGAAGGPSSPRAAPVDLGRLEGMLAGADWPSDDEEDEDYEASASESEGGDAEGAEDGAGPVDAGDGSDGEDEDEECHSDDEGSSLASEDLGGAILDVELTADEMAALAQRYEGVLEDDSEDESEKLVVEGKRRRTEVNYFALNLQMFGSEGTPEGSGAGPAEVESGDEVWSPRVQARKERERKKREKEEEEEEDSSDSSENEQNSDGEAHYKEESGDEKQSGHEEEEKEKEEGANGGDSK